MGIVHEPDGIELTVMPSKLTARDRKEISDSIADHRRRNDNSKSVTEAKDILQRYATRQQSKLLEAKALALPIAERTRLAYRVIASLAAEGSKAPECEWAANAKLQFEQIKAAVQPKTTSKSRRRAKPTAKS